MAVKKKKYLNSTYLDEAGSKCGLTRGKDESVESFLQRVYKKTNNLLSTKREDIYESMGYITPLREKLLLEIGLVSNTQSRIKVSCSKIYVWTDKANDPVIEKELKEYKFIKDLKEDLEQYDDVFSFRQLEGYDPDLKAINLMPFDTDQNYRTLNLTGEINTLPEKYVDEIVDENGFFETKIPKSDFVNSLNGREQYIYDDENQTLYKASREAERFTFNYRMFPVNLVWLPIKITYLDDSDSDYLLLDKDNKDKPRFLSQEGAKIYNKLLQISNTYWGR